MGQHDHAPHSLSLPVILSATPLPFFPHSLPPSLLYSQLRPSLSSLPHALPPSLLPLLFYSFTSFLSLPPFLPFSFSITLSGTHFPFLSFFPHFNSPLRPSSPFLPPFFLPLTHGLSAMFVPFQHSTVIPSVPLCLALIQTSLFYAFSLYVSFAIPS